MLLSASNSLRRTLASLCLFSLAWVLACDEPGTGGLVEGPDSSKGSTGGTGNAACGVYQSVPEDNLIFFIHELVQTAYQPIEVEPDQGGTPNRYTTARKLMFTEIERKRGPQREMVVENATNTNTRQYSKRSSSLYDAHASGVYRPKAVH